MNMKRMAALISCMMLCLCSCGTNTEETGSAAQQDSMPTLQQIYAANTLEAYEEAGIQPSLSSCLREQDGKSESNALLTIYQDEQLGLVSRFRTENKLFHYYFNKDGTDFYCEQEQGKKTTLVIMPNASDSVSAEENETSYAAYLFQKNSFGDYNSKEQITSITDSGDTYHIVTDISASSFTDSSGRAYTYTTQEYDVEKESLRILDLFRSYHFTNSDGTEKKCTLSRCMTYGRQIIALPEFIQDDIKNVSWEREITLVSAEGKKIIAVPANIPVLIDTSNGYEAYTDSEYTKAYLTDEPTDNGIYPDRTIYLEKTS